MDDLEKELLADFGSDESEAEMEGNVSEEDKRDNIGVDHGGAEQDKHGEYDPEVALKKLLNSSSNSFQKALDTFDILKIHDITQDSKISPLIPFLKERIRNYEDTDIDLLESISGNVNKADGDEYQFILMVNEISLIINQEIDFVHSFLKLHYKIIFPELETIVTNPTDYATLILLIKQDINSVSDIQEDLKKIVSNEKVLVITMSAIHHHQQQKHQQQNQFQLNESDFALLMKSCTLILDLNSILKELSTFMANKLYKFAPNVNAIVGPITTSQILTSAGSLRQLSIIPSCNLPSLGVKDLSSQKLGAKSRTVRQTGYLYHNELVKYLPEDIQKPVMRILSGKVVLAARIDLSKSKPDGSIGKNYRLEIENKIEKLLTPPENQGDKALPIPIDQKSKKRGGKRFRKARERFQMSDLRKAQNKMAFGEQEDTIMDSFGEEIGLGMSRGGTGSLAIKVNKNTDAKMSKGLESRLKDKKETLQHLDNLIFTATPQQPQVQKKKDIFLSLPQGTSTLDSTWFSGMKRKRAD